MSTPLIFPISSVTAVRSYLATTFTTAVAAFTQPGVEVYLGQPDHESTQDLIVISSVHRQTPSVRLMGSAAQFRQDEIYTIDVEIACFIPGPNAFPDVDIRAYSILQTLEMAIRKDPSAGGISGVIEMSPDASESTHEWDENDMGGHCNITLMVQVHATY